MILNMGGGGLVPENTLDATTITPGTEDVIIPSGTFLRGDLTVLGDADLSPENIPSDVNLFGIQGVKPPNYGANVWVKRDKDPNQTVLINFEAIFKSSTSTVINGFTVTAEDPDFDLSNLDNSFFAGVTIVIKTSSSGTGTVTFTEDGTWTRVYSSTSNRATGTYTWDPSTGTISSNDSITNGLTQNNGGGVQSVTGNVYQIEYTDLMYVINDNPSAYPDGAYHTDGYWYDLFAQIESGKSSLSEAALDEASEQIASEVNS